MKRLGLLVLIGYTASAGVAHAATYYVAKSGNNGNTCAQAQSTSTAKLTIAEGLKCLSAGDTLFVRGGNYDEGINNNIPSGTSWSSKVRIANYNGETVWLRPSAIGVNNNGFGVWLGGNGLSPRYIEIDGINVDASNMQNAVGLSDSGGANPNNILIQNLEIIGSPKASYSQTYVAGSDHRLVNVKIHGSGPGGCGLPCSTYGIYVAGNRVLVDGCDIYDVNGGGIHIYNSRGLSENNTVRNCRIHDITRSGDARLFGILANGNNHQIYNNLIYGLKLPGTTGTDGSQGAIVAGPNGTKIWNNTIANNTGYGIKVDPGSVNMEVRNNIAYGNSGPAFTSGGSGTTESNNLFGVDPQFVNASGNDFKLKPDSRAVDAGVNVSAVTTDLSGVSRPQGRIHDIGAYEFSGQPAASGPPAPPTGVRIVSN
jgi:hypothetical protein